MKEAGDLMSEQSQHIHFENTNRWSTKQLVTMALMCALGALFMYVQLPILPSAPFLTYDPSLVPAMVCGFAYGPGAGTAVAEHQANHGTLIGMHLLIDDSRRQNVAQRGNQVILCLNSRSISILRTRIGGAPNSSLPWR